jgi:hypothetical protein
MQGRVNINQAMSLDLMDAYVNAQISKKAAADNADVTTTFTETVKRRLVRQRQLTDISSEVNDLKIQKMMQSSS